MMYTTANQKLEQFFYVHDIFFLSQRKNDDDLTEWTYERTPYLEKVLEEYREIVARRKARRASL